MREIKFRAWDKVVKQMKYYDAPMKLTFSSGEIFGYFIPKQEELMQFTGLHDKNGKEIWEGDIFGNIPQLRCVIEWENCRFIFKFLDPKIEKRNLMFNDWARKSEVIGNIYENPELLKP